MNFQQLISHELKCICISEHEQRDALFQQVSESLPDAFRNYARQNERVASYVTSHALVVFWNDQAIGRLVLYENNNLLLSNKKVLLIGNYDCIDHPVAAQFLLEEAQKKAIHLGHSQMIGPINGSTWEHYRWTINNNESPFLTEPFQPPYYLKQWTNFGFSIFANYYSALDSVLSIDTNKILKREQHFLEKGYQWQGLNIQQLENELHELYPLMCSGFEHNYLYSPISEIEFVSKYNAIKPILDPKWVIKAVSSKNEIKGIILSFPDFLQSQPDRIIVKTLVIDSHDRDTQGLGSVLCNLVVRQAKKEGYKAVVAALMHQNNISNNIAKNFESDHFRSYVLLSKDWSS